MSGIIERLRATGKLYNRGPDYEPIPVPPSAINLEAADLLEEAVKALERLESAVRILPPEMDEPDSPLAQARATLTKIKGE